MWLCFTRQRESCFDFDFDFKMERFYIQQLHGVEAD